jgi:hypothetical protein
MTDVALQNPQMLLDRLRALAAQAARNKGMLTAEAQRQAVEVVAMTWAVPAIPPGQILAAAHGLRGNLLAGALAPVWRSLSGDRRQAIVSTLTSEKDEAGTRNVYAAAGLVEEDPDSAVALLESVRPLKEPLERVRVAFFREKPERIRHFIRAQSPQFQIRRVLALLQAAAADSATSPEAQRQTAELLLCYVAEKHLLKDTTFVELLEKLKQQMSRWSAPRQQLLLEFTRKLDRSLAENLFHEISADAAVATTPVEPALHQAGSLDALPPGNAAAAAPRPADSSGGATIALPGAPILVVPDLLCPRAPEEVAVLPAILSQQVRDRRSEAAGLRRQADELTGLADVLERAVAELAALTRQRATSAELQRQASAEAALRHAAEDKAEALESKLENIRQSHGELERRVRAVERNLAGERARVAELQDACRVLEQRIADQETNALAQMQKYSQKHLNDFRVGLARALHASIHDLPRNLNEVAPELVGIVAARLEQVLRELERQGIPLRT